MKKRQLKINKLKTILPPLRTAGLPPPPIPPQRKPHQFIPYVEHHQEKKGAKKIRWKEKNFVEDENTIQIRTTERISTTFSRSFQSYPIKSTYLLPTIPQENAILNLSFFFVVFPAIKTRDVSDDQQENIKNIHSQIRVLLRPDEKKRTRYTAFSIGKPNELKCNLRRVPIGIVTRDNDRYYNRVNHDILYGFKHLMYRS